MFEDLSDHKPALSSAGVAGELEAVLPAPAYISDLVDG